MRRRAGVIQSMSDREVWSVSKWFGHFKGIRGERLTKREYESEVEGRRASSRPCARWLAGVKKACTARNLNLKDLKVMCIIRKQ